VCLIFLSDFNQIWSSSADFRKYPPISNFAKIGRKEDAPIYRGADKSLALSGRKQTTATEDFEFHISYL